MELHDEWQGSALNTGCNGGAARAVYGSRDRGEEEEEELDLFVCWYQRRLYELMWIDVFIQDLIESLKLWSRCWILFGFGLILISS